MEKYLGTGEEHYKSESSHQTYECWLSYDKAGTLEAGVLRGLQHPLLLGAVAAKLF